MKTNIFAPVAFLVPLYFSGLLAQFLGVVLELVAGSVAVIAFGLFLLAFAVVAIKIAKGEIGDENNEMICAE